MAYINKYKIELALKGAKDLMRIYESNPLSRQYIQAKEAKEAFEFVLEQCSEEKDNAISFAEYLREEGYMPVNNSDKPGWVRKSMLRSSKTLYLKFEKQYAKKVVG